MIATDDLPCMRVLTTARSRLTVRLPEEQVPTGWLPPRANPLRVLLDARGRVTGGPLLETALAPTLVFTTAASRGNAARAAWAAAGVEVCEVAAETQAAGASANGSGVSVGVGSDGGDGVALGAVLDELGARGIIQLMVEGGGAVHGAFLCRNMDMGPTILTAAGHLVTSKDFKALKSEGWERHVDPEGKEFYKCIDGTVTRERPNFVNGPEQPEAAPPEARETQSEDDSEGQGSSGGQSGSQLEPREGSGFGRDQSQPRRVV